MLLASGRLVPFFKLFFIFHLFFFLSIYFVLLSLWFVLSRWLGAADFRCDVKLQIPQSRGERTAGLPKHVQEKKIKVSCWNLLLWKASSTTTYFKGSPHFRDPNSCPNWKIFLQPLVCQLHWRNAPVKWTLIVATCLSSYYRMQK